MKKTFLVLGVLGSCLILTQCKKSETVQESHKQITYPVTGQYGNNILGMNDGTIINPSGTFSLAANLQADATLKVVLTNLSTSQKAGWFFETSSNENWNIFPYNDTSNQQTFTSAKGGILDLNLEFSDTLGTFKIELYENNSVTPASSKVMTWHSPTPVIPIDERDSVVGNYPGIYIFTNLDNPPPDTSVVFVRLKKSPEDSVILFYYNDNCYYSFKYHNYQFTSTEWYHPPALTYRNDSLIYFRNPSLGPVYEYFFCKRQR